VPFVDNFYNELFVSSSDLHPAMFVCSSDLHPAMPTKFCNLLYISIIY